MYVSEKLQRAVRRIAQHYGQARRIQWTKRTGKPLVIVGNLRCAEDLAQEGILALLLLKYQDEKAKHPLRYARDCMVDYLRRNYPKSIVEVEEFQLAQCPASSRASRSYSLPVALDYIESYTDTRLKLICGKRLKGFSLDEAEQKYFERKRSKLASDILRECEGFVNPPSAWQIFIEGLLSSPINLQTEATA